jgi:uncharacterized protein
MRVVLDSNILARAAHNPAGPAGELLLRLQAAKHVLIVSPFILDELDRVLRYPRLRTLHGLSDTEIADFVENIGAASFVVATPPNPPVVVAVDPDDDLVIATAVAGQADVLCTLDRHLRSATFTGHCRSYDIEVMTDVELLASLKSA